MTQVKIRINDGMVYIQGQNLEYGNIRNHYKSGDGYSLQLNEAQELQREAILTLCNQIADLSYELLKFDREE